MTLRKTLAVPTFERRRRKRLLTLRNAGIGLVIALLILAGLNIRSEMRDSTSTDEYGRLYGKDISNAPQPEPAVVETREFSPVDEAVSADPFALDAARREQYLGPVSLEPVPLIDPATTVSAAPPRPGSPVRIVGGPDGVTLVHEHPRAVPSLGGGFGRQ